MIDWQKPMQEIGIGRGRLLREGRDVALLTLGPIGVVAAGVVGHLAEEGVSVAHYDMRFAKPLDEAILDEVLSRFGHIVTLEDGAKTGGMGSGIEEYAVAHGYKGRIDILGVPDHFVAHATVAEQYTECGMDAPAIEKALRGE